MGTIKFFIDNGEYWKCENLTKEYNRMGKAMVKAAQSYLAKHKKNASGRLSRSIGYEFHVKDSSLFVQHTFDGVDYWAFVEHGVKGAIDSSKAPDSPFQFGTKTGRPGGLRAGIDRWVILKKLPGFRDAKGRFVPRKNQVRAIARKIYLYGIKPTPFSSTSIDKVYVEFKERLETAWNLDVEAYFDKKMKDEIIMKIQF